MTTPSERNQAVAHGEAMMRLSGFQKFSGSEPKVKIYPARWSGIPTNAFWL
jgi:hypothetical protein